jgi:hypothetical protein
MLLRSRKSQLSIAGGSPPTVGRMTRRCANSPFWITANTLPIPPAEFVKALARNAQAKQFYATLNKTNLYSIAYRLQTAKSPETKLKRIKTIIDMLARGEKFH